MNINDKIADLERQIAELKAEAARPVVEYRAAKWPRDWNREDAEFSDSGKWIAGRLVGHATHAVFCWCKDPGKWFANCRVPIRDTYRTPSLPADAGKVCEFSEDGEKWEHGNLRGWEDDLWYCLKVGSFRYCRIKD